MKLTVLAMMAVVLSGCGILGRNAEVTAGPRLGEVVGALPERIDSGMSAAGRPRREAVLARYRRLVGRIEDPALRTAVARRAAELEAAIVLERAGAGEPVDVSPVIEALRGTIEPEARVPDVHYRLARLQELHGDTDGVLAALDRFIVQSEEDEEAIEARFRRAEIHFGRHDFDAAASDFAAVAQLPSPLQLHAGYMLGWSRFKQGAYREALPQLFDTYQRLSDGAVLGQMELLEDTQRVTVLALDYLDGPETLAAAMTERGRPGWQGDLYEALGHWYRDKGRFTDSVRTWQRFLDGNSLDVNAPSAVLRIMETQRDAGFVAELSRWEWRFIEAFDRRSEYFSVHGPGVFATYADTLRDFLDRRVDRAHATAQETGDAADFSTAAAWYRRWLDNFGGSAGTDHRHFLMAEALLDGGRQQEAVEAFMTLSDEYPNSAFSSEASYAVITILRDLADGEQATAEARVNAAQRFAFRFPDDDRVGDVLAEAAALVFAGGAYEAALDVALQALDSNPTTNLRAAELIVAHSRFELGQYEAAARMFAQLHASRPDEALREKWLVSVFERARQLEGGGDIEGAMPLYESLVDIDGASRLAIDALFDVAALKEQLGRPAESAAHLEVFRDRYPDHPGVADIPQRLVALYEADSRPGRAAAELLAIHGSTPKPEVARQALYRAGELLFQDNDVAGAIDVFRRYAHRYEQPVGLRLEAMNYMDRLYAITGETSKQYYWLRKKVATVRARTNNNAGARVRYLAADAALRLAVVEREKFDRLSLDLPLDRSLEAKRRAMHKALSGYQSATSFEVYRIKGKATLAMAEIYLSLADALMDSERPVDLNDIELEQYEILLEEQAFPFEEKAIEILEANLRRGWSGDFDEPIAASLTLLARLIPGRFDRPLLEVAHASTLY